ncbi:MAG: alpha/beta hydrolase [Actinomycetia bacterium]|nr:alpha/beta hydrolase [Actinomycetes bacterium]
MVRPDARRRQVKPEPGGDPAGPTVALPHCYTGSQQVWTPVTRRLVAAGCRVIRYDQRGHGRSTAGSDGYTLAALGDDLAVVLAATHTRNAVLAGHSMGGMTIQSYAAQHLADLHDRAKAVVLVDTAAYGLGAGGELTPRIAEGDFAQRWAANVTYGGTFVRGTFGTWAYREHLRLVADDYVNTPPDVRGAFAKQFPKMDYRKTLTQIQTPTAILAGSLDTLTPTRLSKLMHAKLPNSTLHILPHKGHMTPLEAPEVIASTILSRTTLQ